MVFSCIKELLAFLALTQLCIQQAFAQENVDKDDYLDEDDDYYEKRGIPVDRRFVIAAIPVLFIGVCILNQLIGKCLLDGLLKKDRQLPPEKRVMTIQKQKEFWCMFRWRYKCGFKPYYAVLNYEIDRRLAEHIQQAQTVPVVGQASGVPVSYHATPIA